MAASFLAKEWKKEVQLNCFFPMFAVGIWLQRKNSFNFPLLNSFESNAATVQIPIGKRILHFSYRNPVNQRRPKWVGSITYPISVTFSFPSAGKFSLKWYDYKKKWILILKPLTR